ncbi:MAG: VPLPA-CTERM-specific exosortase XrtD [Methylococcales bacterium]
MNTFERSASASQSTKTVYFAVYWAAVTALLVYTFRVGLYEMVNTWINVEEYGHGFFLPLISAYFIWLRRNELKFVEKFRAAVPGLIISLIGLIIGILGGLATLKVIEQYAFIITLTGIFTSIYGLHGLRVASVPLFFLVFMVPFPAFILNNLSSKLQLISSWIGVEFIRACNIMVYLEGNVIDLGGYKLQVVDACSGLRYLFPLASLSFLCAYLFKGPFWQKILIFVSSIPLTIFMNSFRIGVIGIMVQYWGTEMAEGFLHDFEGWIIFMACLAVLLGEMWVFSRMSGHKLALNDLVRIPDEWGHHTKSDNAGMLFNKSLWVILGLLATSALVSQYFAGREEIIPERKVFLNFPLKIAAWQGQNEYIAQKYLNELKLTDYVIVNFSNPDQQSSVNFYTAYFQSQRSGASIHSPRSCIPGDGWQITSLTQRTFADINLAGIPVAVNRAVIEKGDSKQLVYYWFQQRGRSITNEFLLKWYLFYDAIAMNRTDGSLIRIITSVLPGEDIEKADQRLQRFMKDTMAELPPYLPGK